MCSDLIRIGAILQRFHTKWCVVITVHRCWNMCLFCRYLFSFHVTRLGIICDVVSSVLLCFMLHPVVYLLRCFRLLSFPLLLQVLSEVLLVKFSTCGIRRCVNWQFVSDVLEETSVSETRWQIITKHSVMSQNTNFLLPDFMIRFAPIWTRPSDLFILSNWWGITYGDEMCVLVWLTPKCHRMLWPALRVNILKSFSLDRKVNILFFTNSQIRETNW